MSQIFNTGSGGCVATVAYKFVRQYHVVCSYCST